MRRVFAPLPLVVIPIALLLGCGSGSGPSASCCSSPHPPGWGHPPKGVFLAGAPASLAGTKQMFDTITLSTVPSKPFALAGYTSGFWPTFLPLRKRWPAAHTISIAVTASHHADCLDIEPGDATPGQAPGWVRAEKAAGWRKPCLYSSFWEFVSEVRPALMRAGIGRQDVFEWDADYVYRAQLDAGFDGTQDTDRAFGRNLDQSTVTPAFLSIAQPPLTTPSPAVKRRQQDRHLHALLARRVRIRRHLLNSGCRVKRPRRACKPLFRRGDEVNREIRVLRSRGAR